MDKNVFVPLVISKSMEFAELATRTLVIMAEIVFVTTGFSEMPINVINVIPLAVNAVATNTMSVLPVLMSVMISTMVFVLEMTLVPRKVYI